MSYKGFERYSDIEIEVLRCFDKYNELVLPDLIPKGLRTVEQLIIKGLVKQTVPFTLTNKGIKVKNYYLKSHH